MNVSSVFSSACFFLRFNRSSFVAFSTSYTATTHRWDTPYLDHAWPTVVETGYRHVGAHCN